MTELTTTTDIESTALAKANDAQSRQPATDLDVVELATRSGDGLEVALHWDRRSGCLWVDVLHLATGETFTVDAQPAHALDVYYHPFAYCLASAA